MLFFQCIQIDPIYIAEIAPASSRGRLVTWSEIATNVGKGFEPICHDKYTFVFLRITDTSKIPRLLLFRYCAWIFFRIDICIL